MNTKIILFVLFLTITLKTYSQNDCNDQTLRDAYEKYDHGNFDEMYSLINNCMNYFSIKQKTDAYRLICMASLMRGQMDTAKFAVERILHYDPDYSPDVVFDLPVFVALINEEKQNLLHQYDETIVSASKREEKISEAPALISTIDSKTIQLRGYKTVAEAINSFTGIDFIEDYSIPNIGVRGINGGSRAGSRIIKLMIDGQPVAFRPSAENFIGKELIPIDMIDHIEILRGPCSSLYGANAFLGVINIITKQTDAFNGCISLGAGRINKNFCSNEEIVISRNFKNLHFLLGAEKSVIVRSGLTLKDMPGRNKYEILNQNTEADISEPMSFFGKFYLNRKSNKFTLDMNLQKSSSSPMFADWSYLESANYVELYNYYIRGQYSHKFNEKIGITNQFSYSHGRPTKNEYLAPHYKVADYVTRRVSYQGFDFKTDLSIGIRKSSYMNIGIDAIVDIHQPQVYYLHLDTLIIPTGEILKDTIFQNYGFYGETLYKPFENSTSFFISNFAFTGGLRFDYLSSSLSRLSYRGGMLFRWKNNMFSKLLISSSFKTPSSTQILTTPLTPGDLIGNPNLKPETALNLEAALGGSITKFINFLVDVYYLKVKDKVEIAPYRVNIMAQNKSSIESYGLEAEIKYASTHFKGFLGFSYNHSIASQFDIFSKHKFYQETDLYPDIMLKTGMDYSFYKPNLSIYIEGRYIGRRFASIQNTMNYDPIAFLTEEEKTYSLPKHIVVDLAVSSYALKFIENKKTFIGLKIYNILNTKYYYPGHLDFDIPGLGRYFDIKVTQYF